MAKVNAMIEIVREYPASLLFTASATLVSLLILAAADASPGRHLRRAILSTGSGVAIGFIASFLYIYADVSGWAVILAPVLLGPICAVALSVAAFLELIAGALSFAKSRE
jgi:hypothetical protein